MIEIAAHPRHFPHNGLAQSEVALILIDMQRDFLEPAGYLAAMGYDLGGVRSAVEPARRLLAAARGAGLCILHTRQGYRPDLGGIRLPHAWSIVDERDLASWIEEKIR